MKGFSLITHHSFECTKRDMNGERTDRCNGLVGPSIRIRLDYVKHRNARATYSTMGSGLSVGWYCLVSVPSMVCLVLGACCKSYGHIVGSVCSPGPPEDFFSLCGTI